MGADYQECLHPEQLPDWVDLIIWCHEHESIPKFEVQENKKIYQPGSTIPTCLTESEGILKHAGLLEIKGKECVLTPHYLEKSYRPMAIISINLDEMEKPGLGLENLESEVIEMVEREIEERIEDR